MRDHFEIYTRSNCNLEDAHASFGPKEASVDRRSHERSLNFSIPISRKIVNKVCSRSDEDLEWRQHIRYDGRAVDALAQAVDEGRGKLR